MNILVCKVHFFLPSVLIFNFLNIQVYSLNEPKAKNSQRPKIFSANEASLPAVPLEKGPAPCFNNLNNRLLRL